MVYSNALGICENYKLTKCLCIYLFDSRRRIVHKFVAMWERFLSKKIELWAVLLLLLGFLPTLVMFCWLVKLSSDENPRIPPLLADMILDFASIPSKVRHVFFPPPARPQDFTINVNDINAYDFITRSDIRQFPLDQHRHWLQAFGF